MTQPLQAAGLAKLVSALIADGTVKFLQWGTGSGAAQSANAVTAGSTTEARVAGTLSAVMTTLAGDTYQVVGTLIAAGARAITELGVFDAAGSGSPPTGGNMDIYGSFAVINLGAGDSIAFTVKVAFS